MYSYTLAFNFCLFFVVSSYVAAFVSATVSIFAHLFLVLLLYSAVAFVSNCGKFVFVWQKTQFIVLCWLYFVY